VTATYRGGGQDHRVGASSPAALAIMPNQRHEIAHKTHLTHDIG
jgi:hypothetical protein